SQFGTANVFSLWWWDAGWLGLGLALAVGAWLGVTYVLATDTAARTGFTATVYLISFPGILALTRINYFGETVFIAPILLLLLARLLRPQPMVFGRAPRAWAASVNGRQEP